MKVTLMKRQICMQVGFAIAARLPSQHPCTLTVVNVISGTGLQHNKHDAQQAHPIDMSRVFAWQEKVHSPAEIAAFKVSSAWRFNPAVKPRQCNAPACK
jgi:hypothetical protein